MTDRPTDQRTDRRVTCKFQKKKNPHSIPAAFLLLYEKISSTSWEDKIPKERTEIVSKLEIHQSQFDCWKQSRKSIRIILLCSNLTQVTQLTQLTSKITSIIWFSLFLNWPSSQTAATLRLPPPLPPLPGAIIVSEILDAATITTTKRVYKKLCNRLLINLFATMQWKKKIVR